MAKKEDLVEVVGVAEQCKASGERIKKGKKANITRQDARLLNARGFIKYANEKETPDARRKGITSERVKAK